MPNLRKHCEISKLRTGEDYEELHKWIDEGVKALGYNHRIERHFFMEGYKDFIEEKWGKEALTEWLIHIAIDNLETASKLSKEDELEFIKIIFQKNHVQSLEIKVKEKEAFSIQIMPIYEETEGEVRCPVCKAPSILCICDQNKATQFDYP